MYHSLENCGQCNSLLFDHHIMYILKSGLILDEDMDNLMNSYNIEDETYDDQKIPILQKMIGACSFASMMFSLYKKYPVWLSAISLAPCAAIMIRRIRYMVLRKRQISNVETLVDTVRKISKLNRTVAEYFRLRRITDPNTVAIYDPYTKGMRQLIKLIFTEEVNLLYSLRIFVRQFGSYVPSIKTDYAYLENLEFNDFSSSNVKNVEDGVVYLEKLCDIFVLLSSNCLSCLALVLCPSVWTENEVDINEIMNKLVPKMKAVTVNCYNAINRKFDDVKYYYLNRSQAKNKIKKPKPSAAGKLQICAYNTMSYTTDILEKSHIIYKKLQEVQLQSLTEKENLAKCIYELRGQVFDYYESLDVLYKIFQVNINACQGKSPSSHLEIPREPICDIDVDKIVPDASLNPVEPSDDEEYELYIGANESSSDGTNCSYHEEESRKFASLLSQELKQKLRNHAQFVAARKKRGIIDEEPEEVDQEVKPSSRVKLPVSNENQVQINRFEPPRLLFPPPPPPPLPPLDLGPYGGNTGSLYTVDDFLEAIKAASQAHKGAEEVFGGDSDDD